MYPCVLACGRPWGFFTTIHSSVEVSTLRAIFSIAGFEGLKPLHANGLRENPCYPNDLVDDPGWALLTDGPWYNEPANVKYQQSTIPYQKATDLKKVRDALAKPKTPRWFFQDIPNIQALKMRLGLKDEKRMWKKWVGDGLDRDGDEDDLDAYSDNELDKWFDEYRSSLPVSTVMATATGGDHAPSPTAPPEVEAESTPTGQGEGPVPG